MPASTVRCFVLDGDVTVVTDINGDVTNVVCPQFRRMNHACKKKVSESGLLGMLGKVIGESTGGTKGYRCEFSTLDNSPLAQLLK